MGQHDPRKGAGWLRTLSRALRARQWVKNLLVFVPAILAHKLFDLPVALRAGTAFAAFCLAASATYLLNDLLDVERTGAMLRSRTGPSLRVNCTPGSDGCSFLRCSGSRCCWHSEFMTAVLRRCSCST